MQTLVRGFGEGIGRGATQQSRTSTGGGHPERTIWLLGTLIPVLLAALRLMVVSQGDPETLRSLVQDLNITALLLATVIPLAGTILTLTAFFLVVSTYDQTKKESRKTIRSNHRSQSARLLRSGPPPSPSS